MQKVHYISSRSHHGMVCLPSEYSRGVQQAAEVGGEAGSFTPGLGRDPCENDVCHLWIAW